MIPPCCSDVAIDEQLSPHLLSTIRRLLSFFSMTDPRRRCRFNQKAAAGDNDGLVAHQNLVTPGNLLGPVLVSYAQ